MKEEPRDECRLVEKTSRMDENTQNQLRSRWAAEEGEGAAVGAELALSGAYVVAVSFLPGCLLCSTCARSRSHALALAAALLLQRIPSPAAGSMSHLGASGEDVDLWLDTELFMDVQLQSGGETSTRGRMAGRQTTAG